MAGSSGAAPPSRPLSQGVTFLGTSRGSNTTSKLERFRSILGVIVAPFWDPAGVPKQGVRGEGVAFFEKSRGSKNHRRNWSDFAAFWGSFWLHFGTPRASKNKVFGSCWPPGELFLELFGSPFLNALAKKKVKTLIFADSSLLFQVF